MSESNQTERSVAKPIACVMEASLRPLGDGNSSLSEIMSACAAGESTSVDGRGGRGLLVLYLDPESAQMFKTPNRVVSAWAQTGEPVPKLTRTERAVVNLLAEGKTNNTIAKELYVSVNTVKTHVRAIFQKLGVHSRSSAVRRAIGAGIID